MYGETKIKLTETSVLILGFHRALLQSITFISWPNAFDCTKLRS